MNVDADPGRTRPGATLQRTACAKLNLDLRVLGTREDGYHQLQTVFQTIALHDVLRFEGTPEDQPLAITCDDPSVPCGPANLVWRAAVRLWSSAGRTGEPSGCRVHLRKRIPSMGGLGGGSADAAVALVALREIWGLSIAGEALVAQAAALGADVPFFLLGGSVLAQGRGDVLQPWPDLPRLEIVLVFPPFGVSTLDAYRWFDEASRPTNLGPGSCGNGSSGPRAFNLVNADGERSSERQVSRSSNAAPPSDWRAWLSSCRNDLQPAVASHHPVIDELCRVLSSAGAVLASMSGSGSTVFGLFDDTTAADRGFEGVRRRGFAVERTRTLCRAAYLDQAFGPASRRVSEER